MRISGVDTDIAHLLYTDFTCPSPHAPKLVQYRLIIFFFLDSNITGSEFCIFFFFGLCPFFLYVLL